MDGRRTGHFMFHNLLDYTQPHLVSLVLKSEIQYLDFSYLFNLFTRTFLITTVCDCIHVRDML